MSTTPGVAASNPATPDTGKKGFRTRHLTLMGQGSLAYEMGGYP